jgi:hypothetical protein
MLVAVLTCIPSDNGQQSLISALRRVLKPGGLVYVVDYVLQGDERNQKRYREAAEGLGPFGVFSLPEGAVFRHHTMVWIHTLLADFQTLDIAYPKVTTMNGNSARAFQYLGKSHSKP